MKMFIASENSPSFFKEFTLVMPAVAVGNVAQLAVDLIVSTLNMKRVGYIHTDCLVPMAGNNPYTTCKEDAEELHTPAEVYSAPELKLAILQIRAPVIPTKSKKFRQLIVSWIKSSGFSRTVLLSSSHAYQRDDQQLQGTPLRYLVTPSLLKVSEDVLKELGWREMERVPVFPGVTDTNAEPHLCIPGGGITKGLFTDSCSEDLPLAVLLLFCSEGDNIPDAFTLVNHLNDWLHLLDNPSQEANKWKIPNSWRLLFGSSVPSALF
ncbi:proteasome assembly chaperone 2 [Cynoglossus semilaevis]|uniref:Proteasome assembly chaperone 2 n=1 Tax=Cynoglossus semilaevis TaxID=244447 RepID=A0A3P8W8A5_CYNSE|nr:proteasome assembly chaperone 2 [Cynoglossus semilaevis]